MNKIERSSVKLESDMLRSFVAVAERGSVTRAADDLHRTQSAVSVQIKRLESVLGVAVFAREPRGMTLTTAGEKLLVSARSILLQLDRAAAGVVGDPVEGSVAVGIPDDYGSDLLAGVLADFARRHPLVEVNITCGFSVEFPRDVERGRLDLAVYAGDQGDTGGEILLQEQTVWVAGGGLSWTPGTTLPITLFDRSCWWRDAALLALDIAGLAYRIAYSSESVAGVKAAVKAGLAVGVLARSTVEPGMRIFGAAEGLPPLPSSNLVLVQCPGLQGPAVPAMAAAIRQGFSRFIERGAA